MSASQDLASPSLSVESIVISPLATLSVTLFFYGEYLRNSHVRIDISLPNNAGIYVLLVGTCVTMLLGRMRASPSTKLYLACNITLFAVITAATVIMATSYAQHAVAGLRLVLDPNTLSDYEDYDQLFNATGTIADAMLVRIASVLYRLSSYNLGQIHRCHIIWGSRSRITFPLIAASLISTGVNIAVEVLACIDSLTTENFIRVLGLIGEVIYAGVNLALTLLTAGRVWWVLRQVEVPQGRQAIRTKYSALVTINRAILESGIIYPVVIMVHLSTSTRDLVSNSRIDLLPVVTLAAGIAPTLIIVRASLGQGVEQFTQTGGSKFTTFQLTEGSASVSRVGEIPDVEANTEVERGHSLRRSSEGI
ncbi:hypothetical protein VNI00_009478 [Paramarasmius palmivorus]|uniref:Fungal pheromone mating factor STE2 GPCR-domain-containing protein n=1 Tax=Paramarasmius palmivorus TaxID=297713 RepID=A0AAW0CNI2_9AGAR